MITAMPKTKLSEKAWNDAVPVFISAGMALLPDVLLFR